MQFSVVPVDSSDASRLLDEYFTSRELGFTGGTYTRFRPDPAVFTAPAGVFVLVQEDDGASIGCGGIRRIADSDDGAVRYEVKHLYLQVATRGRGLGRALLADLEKRAADLGAQQVVLDTNASLTAAGGLYRSSGYRSVEPYNDNPNATDWFQKDL
jgi:ribosomal protein S18 acetylase RimI-like enzyme